MRAAAAAGGGSSAGLGGFGLFIPELATPPSVQIGVALSRAPIGSLRRAWQLG
jgi:hypothetical protein